MKQGKLLIRENFCCWTNSWHNSSPWFSVMIKKT